MNGSPPSSKRRRRHLAAVLALFALVAGLLAYRDNEQQKREHEWLEQLGQGIILTRLTNETGFPFIDRHSGLVRLLGRHRVVLFLMNADDAMHVLTIPECPMPIHIISGREVSTELRDRLRSIYGNENVE